MCSRLQQQILNWYERGDPKDQPLFSKLQLGDTVLVQNHCKGPFDPKHIGDHRAVSLKGNQVEVQSTNGGPTEMKHITHVKYSYLPTDILTSYQIILHLEERQHSG